MSPIHQYLHVCILSKDMYLRLVWANLIYNSWMDHEHSLAGLDVIPFAKARCRNSLFNNSSKSALNLEVELFPYFKDQQYKQHCYHCQFSQNIFEFYKNNGKIQVYLT